LYTGFVNVALLTLSREHCRRGNGLAPTICGESPTHLTLCFLAGSFSYHGRTSTSVAELTDAEASSLGNWQVRLSRALQTVLGCQKTYVAQFAEAEGFAHVHFHIVPRPVDLSSDLWGPRIFRLLGADDCSRIGVQATDEIAIKLAKELDTW
jgi:hypothetical protein